MSAKPAKETITEKELGEIKRDRVKLNEAEASAYEATVELGKTPAAQRLRLLNQEVAQMKTSLAEREQGVIERLRRKVEVIGKFVALIEVIEGQCRPSWLNAFVALAARMKLDPKAEEKRVRAATEKPKEYRLVIE